jgi:hypothetical protein
MSVEGVERARDYRWPRLARETLDVIREAAAS